MGKVDRESLVPTVLFDSTGTASGSGSGGFNGCGGIMSSDETVDVHINATYSNIGKAIVPQRKATRTIQIGYFLQRTTVLDKMLALRRSSAYSRSNPLRMVQHSIRTDAFAAFARARAQMLDFFRCTCFPVCSKTRRKLDE